MITNGVVSWQIPDWGCSANDCYEQLFYVVINIKTTKHQRAGAQTALHDK